jgi:hypothetical protein
LKLYDTNSVLFDRATGKVTARANTGERVDEIAYDPGLHIAYCATRQGKISVVSVGDGKLTALGDVPDEPGTGDVVVDPQTTLSGSRIARVINASHNRLLPPNKGEAS